MKKIINLTIVILIMTALASTVLAKTGTVNTQGLNLRDGATTVDTNILKKLDKGVTINIIEETSDWYKVSYEDLTGYVKQEYVDVNPETSTGTTTGETGIQVEQECKMISDAKVYALPLINSSKISNISNGTKVTIISETANWKYIQTDSISGWVIASKVQGNKAKPVSAPIQDEQTQESNETSQNNAVEGNTTTQEPEVPASSEENQTAEQNTTSNSNLVNDNEQTSIVTFPATMYVNVDAVNIRKGPSTETERVTSVGINTPVTVRGEEGEWYKVEVSDGSGYMKKEFLSKTRT